MLTTTEIAGFAGAGLAGAAYVPQISHLIRARCSAGISRLAFEVWLLASLLVTVRAIAIDAGVFIALGGIQIVATAIIVVYATWYKNTSCPIHLPRQPGAKTATGTGILGNEPGSWRPAGRPVAASATPAGRGGALRAHVPVRHPRSDAVTARLGREPDVQVFRSWPRPRVAEVSLPGSGRSPGGVARAHASERCANAAVHTFGSALDFQRRT
jgi:PQ loop repeat